MIEPVSKSMVYGGATAAVYGWFTVTEWAAMFGGFCAAIGIVIQILSYMNKKSIDKNDAAIKEEKRRQEEEEHRINMQILHAKLDQLTKS